MKSLCHLAIFAVAAIFLGACTGLGPGFGERDDFVVHTPEYGDNRVYYVIGSNDVKNWKPQASLKAGYVPLESTERPIAHGRPLSIIVNSVSLPKREQSAFAFARGRDIALLVQVATAADGTDKWIVVWYERGVRDDESLNFSNLVIHHEPFWDERVAPLFRIRLVDVAEERNIETRVALSEVSKFAGVLGAAIPNPAVNPIINVATKAASLVLANQKNKVLLDYTVQFYSRNIVSATPDAGLTTLREGAFVLLGKPQNADRSFWANDKFQRNYATNTIETLANDGKSFQPILSPFVQVTVSTSDTIVPNLVAKRSAALREILTSAASENAKALERTAQELLVSAKAFSINEKVRRYRGNGDLRDLVEAARTGKVQVGNGQLDMADDDLAFLMRTLSTLSGCTLTDKSAVSAWWTNVAGNGSAVKFKEDKFELKTHGKCN